MARGKIDRHCYRWGVDPQTFRRIMQDIHADVVGGFDIEIRPFGVFKNAIQNEVMKNVAGKIVSLPTLERVRLQPPKRSNTQSWTLGERYECVFGSDFGGGNPLMTLVFPRDPTGHIIWNCFGTSGAGFENLRWARLWQGTTQGIELTMRADADANPGINRLELRIRIGSDGPSPAVDVTARRIINGSQANGLWDWINIPATLKTSGQTVNLQASPGAFIQDGQASLTRALALSFRNELRRQAAATIFAGADIRNRVVFNTQ